MNYTENELQRVFQYSTNVVEIRTKKLAGENWFVAKDVCDVLEIANSRDALTRLDDDEKGVGITDTLGGKQEVQFINESGLYNLIFQSRKPEAKRFRKWVTSDLLPSLRRTGRYALSKPKTFNPYADFESLPVIDYEGKEYYPYTDVCKLLGYCHKCGSYGERAKKNASKFIKINRQFYVETAYANEMKGNLMPVPLEKGGMYE